MHKKISDLYCGLPRGGPGSEGSTIRALRIIRDLACNPMVLDAGCGTGASTIVLSRNLDCEITAIDITEQAIARLRRKVEERGLETRIKALIHDMGEVKSLNKKFDLIWSEGAIYNLGFENGLRKFSKVLNKGGYTAVTELTLQNDDIPGAVKEYWGKYYPGAGTIEKNLEIINNCGFSNEGYFWLPESDWIDDFYKPMAEAIPEYRRENEGIIKDPELRNELEELEEEIDFFNKYSRFFGYVFYVMRKM